jgi:hypothetical protein
MHHSISSSNTYIFISINKEGYHKVVSQNEITFYKYSPAEQERTKV